MTDVVMCAGNLGATGLTHMSDKCKPTGAVLFSVEDTVRARIETIPDIARAIVFGSRALGDAEERSDLDLALSCPGISRRRWAEIADAVEQAETLIAIDLIWLEDAPSALRDEILRSGKVIYERA